MRIVLSYLCIVLLLNSCKKSENLGSVDDIPGLGGDTWGKGPIDTWIYSNLTKPFNISVKYKWDQFELELNKNLVPPMEEKIVPVMEAVKKVWIDTYIAEAGDVFMKTYCPKFFVLCGSASWNTDGTITLGTAEGGRKIVLYVLNDFRTKAMADFRASDSMGIKQMFHTIEHEFGHILHQNVLYPDDYKRITPGFYTANWNNVSDNAARRDGFVTAYAMSAPDEDFVEMISSMLSGGSNGPSGGYDEYEALLTQTGGPSSAGYKTIKAKEAVVVDYFQRVWNINFYALRAKCRSAFVNYLQ